MSHSNGYMAGYLEGYGKVRMPKSAAEDNKAAAMKLIADTEEFEKAVDANRGATKTDILLTTLASLLGAGAGGAVGYAASPRSSRIKGAGAGALAGGVLGVAGSHLLGETLRARRLLAAERKYADSTDDSMWPAAYLSHRKMRTALLGQEANENLSMLGGGLAGATAGALAGAGIGGDIGDGGKYSVPGAAIGALTGGMLGGTAAGALYNHSRKRRLLNTLDA